ncbi:O-antigen ligase family protein [Cellulophaga baltica]|nr:O-antigen ligase family protein [Cellulophaga baltica]
MKKNIIIIVLILQLILCILPILPHGIISVCLIAYSIGVIILYLKSPEVNVSKKDIKYLFSQISFYILFCFSIFYSENITTSFRIIQHSILLLIFPFLSVFGHSISKKRIFLLGISFVVSSLVLAIYICVYLMLNYNISYILSGSLVYHVIKANKLIFEIHPIYTSVFFLIAILLILNYLIIVRFALKKSLIAILPITIFSLTILLLASKTIVFLALMTLITLFFLDKRISKIHRISLISSLTLLIILASLSFKTLNNRISDFTEYLTTNNRVEKNLENSTNIRANLFVCSKDLIYNEFLLGYGIGDVQAELDKCLDYYEIKSKIVSAHNFYLRLALSAGVLCSILFIYSLFFNLKIAIIQKSIISIIILSIFICLCLFEDYLLRAYGVTLYSVFVHFLYLYDKNCNNFFLSEE